MHITLIGVLAAVFYLLAGGLLGVRLSRAATESWNKNALLGLGLLAAMLHALLLARLVLLPEGLNLAFFNALTFTAWLIAVVLLLTALVRPVENLGIILLPFSAISVLLALFFPGRRIVSEPYQWPLELHVLISVLAYALLTLAAVQALLLALQDQRLRQRRPGGFLHGMPPLTTMESLLFQMIGLGFAFLSLALLSGFFFLDDIFAQHLVHKTTLSLLAWVVFGILLWGRRRFGWRGRKAIRWTLAGFSVLVLAYFGSKLVLELILQR